MNAIARGLRNLVSRSGPFKHFISNHLHLNSVLIANALFTSSQFLLAQICYPNRGLVLLELNAVADLHNRTADVDDSGTLLCVPAGPRTLLCPGFLLTDSSKTESKIVGWKGPNRSFLQNHMFFKRENVYRNSPT